MALPMPELEGKYEILEKIREGGMGAIYKVRHRLLDEVRVIKVMRQSIEKNDELRAVDRFMREARIAIKLRHPNIAQLYDFSADAAGNGLIVMEFIDGLTLDEILDASGPPSVALTLELATQSLEALGALHETGFVHRDISPDNLMLTRDIRGRSLVKLIDLGIAKLVATDEAEGVTKTGTFLGKYKYASPEMFQDAAGSGIDCRSDLYSFGIVLYQLLTNQHPITGTDVSSVIAGHLFRPPLSFDESDTENLLPTPLREVVLKSLAKKPEDRYQNAEEMVEALEHVQRELKAEEDPQEVGALMALRDRLREERAGRPGTGTQQEFNDIFPAAQATQVPEGDDDRTVMLDTSMATSDRTIAMQQGAPTTAFDRDATTMMPTQGEIPLGPVPVGAGAPRVPAAAPGRNINPLVYVGVAVGVLILILVGILASRGGSDSRPGALASDGSGAGEGPQASAVELADGSNPLPGLVAQAQAAIDSNDWDLAEEKLVEIDAATATLSPEEVAQDQLTQVAVLRENIVQARVERVTERLAAALERGDRDSLQAILEKITPQEEDSLKAVPERAATLERARSALGAMNRFERALNSSEPEQALVIAFTLANSQPAVATSLNAKERAARAVERRIDELVAAGSIDAASRSAEALRGVWPTRSGLRERMDRIQRLGAASQNIQSLLDEGERALNNGQPHLGLELLDRSVPPQFRDQVAQLKQRLQEDLERRDRRAPQFALFDEAGVAFEKGAPVVVSLKVQDDYGVVAVGIEALNAEGEVLKRPAEPIGDGVFRVTVPANFHKDEPFRFWALAVDHSGNEGRLGASNRPLEVRRKRWFRRGG